jgi:hypothetical protein
MPSVVGIGDDEQVLAGGHHQCVVAGGLRFEGYVDPVPRAAVVGRAARPLPSMVHGPILAHEPVWQGYLTAMDPRRDPDQGDPTNQSGRPWMITAAPIGLLLALALLVVVFFIAR